MIFYILESVINKWYLHLIVWSADPENIKVPLIPSFEWRANTVVLWLLSLVWYPFGSLNFFSFSFGFTGWASTGGWTSSTFVAATCGCSPYIF